MRQAWIAFALSQQCQLRLEQHPRRREHTDLEGGLIVIGEVAAGSEPMEQRNLEIVLVAIGEIRHLRVKCRPARHPPPHTTLRAERKAVARGLQVRCDLALVLDVVEHELREERGDAPPFHIHTQEIVHVACAVALDQQPHIERVQVPGLGLPPHAGPHAPLPQRRTPTASRVHVHAMLEHEAVHGGAGRVRRRIELRRDRLDLQRGRADPDVQVIQVVRIVREEQPGDAARAPVAVEDPEEHLAISALRAQVRLGDAQAVATGIVPLGIEAQPGVLGGMGRRHEWAELRRERHVRAHECPARPHWQQRHAASYRQRVAQRLRGGGHPSAPLNPIMVARRISELGEQAAHRPPDRDARANGVGRPERGDQVRPPQRTGERGGVADRAQRDQVLHIRHGPVLDGHIWGGSRRCSRLLRSESTGENDPDDRYRENERERAHAAANVHLAGSPDNSAGCEPTVGRPATLT